MEHKEILEDLNRQKLEKIDEYLKTKNNGGEEHSARLEEAKSNWQEAWGKYMDVLMYLETLEI